jgi:hypothetical protein
MKNKKHYFVVEFVLDLHFREDEDCIYYAESEEKVKEDMQKHFGEHLLAMYVRKATWIESRRFKKNKIVPCIA